MKLNLIKQVSIFTYVFDIEYDKNSDGASFSFTNRIMKIGIKSIKKDPKYVLSIISHELMEAIFIQLGARYDNICIENNYLFSFNHQTFENAIQIHTELLTKFIKQ